MSQLSFKVAKSLSGTKSARYKVTAGFAAFTAQCPCSPHESHIHRNSLWQAGATGKTQGKTQWGRAESSSPAQLLHHSLAGGFGTKHSVQEGTGRQFPSLTTSTSLGNHEAVLGAQQAPLLFPFHEEIPQFGGGEGDQCLLPVVQTCLLEPGALKALGG